MKRRTRNILGGAVAALIVVGLLAAWWTHYDSLESRLGRAVAAGATSFDFAAETDFEWDRMHVFGPYTTRGEVETAIGSPWPDFERTNASMSDATNLVVFVKGKTVMDWYEQPRRVEMGRLDSKTGYARTDAHFAIDRTGGGATLYRR